MNAPSQAVVAVNGYYPADFDGSGSALVGAPLSTYFTANAWTFAALIFARTEGTDLGSSLRYKGECLASDTNGVFSIAYTASGITVEIFDGTTRSTLTAACSTSEWHYVQITYNGTILSLQIDDAVPVTQAFAAMATLTGNLQYGCNYNQDAFFDGLVLELQTSKTVLSTLDTQRTGMEDRYGVSLSSPTGDAVNPTSLDMSAILLDGFSGSPWNGTASAGTSGSRSVTGAASVSTLQNGHAGATFNGTTHKLADPVSFSDSYISSTGYYYSVVVKPTVAEAPTGSVYNDPIIFGDDGCNYGLTFTSDGFRAFQYDSTTGWTGPVLSAVAGSYYFVEVWHDGTNLHLRVNGVEATSVAIPMTWLSTYITAMVPILGLSSGANGLTGTIQALLVSQSVPSTANRSGIAVFLQDRYALDFGFASSDTAVEISGASAVTVSATATVRARTRAVGSTSASFTSVATVRSKARGVVSSATTFTSTTAARSRVRLTGVSAASVASIASGRVKARVAALGATTFVSTATIRQFTANGVVGLSTVSLISTASIKSRARNVAAGTIMVVTTGVVRAKVRRTAASSLSFATVGAGRQVAVTRLQSVPGTMPIAANATTRARTRASSTATFSFTSSTQVRQISANGLQGATTTQFAASATGRVRARGQVTTALAIGSNSIVRAKRRVTGISSTTMTTSAGVRVLARLSCSSTNSITAVATLRSKAKLSGSSGVSVSGIAPLRSSARVIGATYVTLTSTAYLTYVGAGSFGNSTTTVSTFGTVRSRSRLRGAAYLSFLGTGNLAVMVESAITPRTTGSTVVLKKTDAVIVAIAHTSTITTHNNASTVDPK